MGKQVEKQLRDISKLKGAALQERYTQIVGTPTRETNRDKLLKGIAKALIAAADAAKAKEADEAKAKTKQEKKGAAKPIKPKKGPKVSTGVAAGPTQAPAHDAAVAATAPNTTADVGTAPNEPDNASGAPVDAAAAPAALGAKRRGAARATGERDPRLPPAGTVLTREYKGNTLKVTLLQDNGCLYEGRQYRSLSGVVKELTGTNHNGILWFNLIKRPTKAKPAAAPAAQAPADEKQEQETSSEPASTAQSDQ